MEKCDQAASDASKTLVEYIKTNHKQLPHNFFISSKNGKCRLCRTNKHGVFHFTDIHVFTDINGEVKCSALYVTLKDNTFWKDCSHFGVDSEIYNGAFKVLPGTAEDWDKAAEVTNKTLNQMSAEDILQFIADKADEYEGKKPSYSFKQPKETNQMKNQLKDNECVWNYFGVLEAVSEDDKYVYVNSDDGQSRKISKAKYKIAADNVKRKAESLVGLEVEVRTSQKTKNWNSDVWFSAIREF